MKTKILLYLILGMVFLGSGSVFAQQAGHSITIGTDVGQPGGTVTVTMDWDTGTGVFYGVSYFVAFDAAILTFDSCSLNPAHSGGFAFTTCGLAGGRVNVQLIPTFVPNDGPVPTGQIGTLTFTIANPAPFGPTSLTPQNPEIGTGEPDPTLNSGSVTVVGPRYSSAPLPQDGVSMGGPQTTTVNEVVEIDNTSLFDTTLTGDGTGCVLTDDGTGKFSLSGDTQFSVPDEGPNAFVTVSCNSADVGQFTGEMQCTHDGDNITGPTSSPAIYALTCDITEGPQPRYTGTAVNLNMTPTALEEGDAALTGSLTIDNILGDGPISGFPNGSILTGAGTGCTYTPVQGTNEITVTNQGDFSLQQVGGPTRVLTWSCNTAAQGSYSGTLSCDHNGVNVVSSQDYTLTCNVGPPGDAGYASVPGPGGTVNMTPTGDSLVDSLPAPTGILTITNTPPGLTPANDRDLLLDCGLLAGGDPEITATPASNQLAPGASSIVNFSCDNDTAGSFSATYECDYDEDGRNGDTSEGNGAGTASYTVTCGVRNPESDVDPSPTPGELLTILVPQGGTNTVSVFLIETIGEGADDAGYECSLGDDTFFSITSDSGGEIDSAETIEIVVEGRDPRPDEISASTTLTCNWVDSSGDDNSASWPIEIRVPAAEIPTMSDWSRILLILSLLAVGGFVVRRRLTA